jgi:outer membrane protein assembly factor BamB
MPRDLPSLVYAGVKTSVVAFDRRSGTEAWRIALPAKYRSTATIVNVVRDSGGLFASCAGELFALDPATGAVLWRQPLKGLGTGLVSITTDLGGGTPFPVLAEEKRRADAAHAAAAG